MRLLARLAGRAGKNSRWCRLRQIESDFQQLSAEEAVVFAADLGIEIRPWTIDPGKLFTARISIYLPWERRRSAPDITAKTAARWQMAPFTGFRTWIFRAEVVAYWILPAQIVGHVETTASCVSKGRGLIVMDGI
jgi:hypothetical protein